MVELHGFNVLTEEATRRRQKYNDTNNDADNLMVEAESDAALGEELSILKLNISAMISDMTNLK